MRRGHALIVIAAAALLGLGGYAVGRSGTTPRRLPSGWIAYAPLGAPAGHLRRPRAEPYVLYTHCGIAWARIRGTFWRASPALSDGQGNPPAGWGNPFQAGTLTFTHATTALFRSPAGSVSFRRTLRTQPPVICS